MTDPRHRYEFNLGPPTNEQVRFLRDLTTRLEQPFTPPAMHAEASMWIRGVQPSRHRISADERLALRRALEECVR